ncbi:uncharacterized protein [Montipora foliosa]|uniref:uncharacterized protein n=1 Tax=Montipora foliosa TaxID=591990 RepID=UPI0035F1F4CE
MSQGNVTSTSQKVNSQEMARQFGLPAPEPLDLSGGNTSENWKKFKQKFTNYEIATGINEKESAIRVATLLTVIGNDAYDVFNMITWDAEGDDKRIDKVLQKFEEHCEPKKNVTYERYQFFSRAQKSGETIDEYVTELRKLSETCEFGTLRNSLIKDRIVLGVNNCTTRERLLGVHVLTLEKAVDVVRSAEMTEKQAQKWESDSSVQDSIMALYAPKSQSNQPQMYGVPGGMYITPQQQPHPNTPPSLFNNIRGMPAQGIPMGMTQGVGNPLQQGFMQQRQQQQQQQVAQVQQQMQQMRLKQQTAAQQPNMQSGQGAFGSSLPGMGNGWMSSQQPMSFPQQQHAQYVTTGPAPNSMNYGGYPVGLMPGSGQTMSHQLWK